MSTISSDIGTDVRFDFDGNIIGAAVYFGVFPLQDSDEGQNDDFGEIPIVELPSLVSNPALTDVDNDYEGNSSYELIYYGSYSLPQPDEDESPPSVPVPSGEKDTNGFVVSAFTDPDYDYEGSPIGDQIYYGTYFSFLQEEQDTPIIDIDVDERPPSEPSLVSIFGANNTDVDFDYSGTLAGDFVYYGAFSDGAYPYPLDGENPDTPKDFEILKPIAKNNLYNPLEIPVVKSLPGVRSVWIDENRSYGITKKQPKNTNPAYNTNFRLMIPKVREGVYFCTQVEFPSMTMTPINVAFNRAASLNFFGDKIEQDSLSIKFIVNENYSNWYEMSDWFSKSINYYGFFRDNSQARMNDIVVDSTQLLILNNKKIPKVRISFDGLMITSLGNMPMNSGVSDSTILTCDASFQFTSFDIEEI